MKENNLNNLTTSVLDDNINCINKEYLENCLMEKIKNEYPQVAKEIDGVNIDFDVAEDGIKQNIVVDLIKRK